MADPRRLAHIVWPSEAPVDEGRADITGAPAAAPPDRRTLELEARIAHPLAAIAAELHAIREALAPTSGTPFTLPNAGNLDGAGNGFVLYDGPRPGNVWRIDQVVVSVDGASAAASVELYNDGPTPDELALGGFLPSLSGAGPSRGFLAPPSPMLVIGGAPVLIRVLGAAPGGQFRTRIQGQNEAIGGD